MPLYKKGIILVCSLLCVWGTARFCHHQTKGFRIEKIRGNTSPNPNQISVPISTEHRNLLDQKFTYFGRGLQSFSFLGEDGETVLKIFNNRYQKKIFWASWLPSKEERVAYLQKKLGMTFASYQIAYEELRSESGLLYFHPRREGADLPPLQLIDPLGIAHTLDGNEVGFVLQKRATLVYPYLEACSEFEAKQAIEELVTLLKSKMERGIGDRDPLIRANVGFLNGRAMQIDVGPLYHDPSLQDEPKQKLELEKAVLSLKHWLETHHPSMVSYLKDALENR